MALAALLAFIAALLTYFADRKSFKNRFLAGGMVIGALGLFGSYMEYDLNPWLQARYKFSSGVNILSSFFLSLGHYFAPYTYYLLFMLFYSGVIKSLNIRLKTFIVLVVMTPTISMYFISPVGVRFLPNFKFLAAWSGVYLLITIILHYVSIRHAQTQRDKREKMYMSLIYIPASLAHYVLVFLSQAFGNTEIWKYTYFIIILGFIVFIIVLVRYGLLGLRIKYEKIGIANTFIDISTSQMFFNHALKNELSKISLCSSSISRVIGTFESEAGKQSIQKATNIIDNSVSHLTDMLERSKQSMEMTVLPDESINLLEMVLDIKESFSTSHNEDIHFNIFTDFEVFIKGDPVHIRECLNNIIRNACEAMGQKGILIATFEKKDKYIRLLIEDNGPGIPEDLIHKLFIPFFSTKKCGLNFGLGLTYCYNVMKKHDGEIEVLSQLGKGTGVSLIFPSKRIIALNSIHNKTLLI